MTEESEGKENLAGILANRDAVWARVCHYHWGGSIEEVARLMKMDVTHVANTLNGPITAPGEASHVVAFLFALQLAVAEPFKNGRQPPALRGGGVAVAAVVENYVHENPNYAAGYLMSIAKATGIVTRIPTEAEIRLFYAGKLRGVSTEQVLNALLPPMTDSGKVGFRPEEVERLTVAAVRRFPGDVQANHAVAAIACEWFENLVGDEPVPSRWSRASIQTLLPRYWPKGTG